MSNVPSSVYVRLPNGLVRAARLGGLTGTGHRTASVRVTNSKGRVVRIAGRVTTRHGYDRVLPFEVNMDSVNARTAFLKYSDEPLFVAAVG